MLAHSVLKISFPTFSHTMSLQSADLVQSDPVARHSCIYSSDQSRNPEWTHRDVVADRSLIPPEKHLLFAGKVISLECDSFHVGLRWVYGSEYPLTLSTKTMTKQRRLPFIGNISEAHSFKVNIKAFQPSCPLNWRLARHREERCRWK